MRGLGMCLVLFGVAAGPLAAQDVPDSHPHPGHLRDKIEKRFAERVKVELELTDEQAVKLKAVAMEHAGRRRELRHRERDLRTALDAQLRAGSGTDQDSVGRLTRDLLDLRIQYAESWREEMGKLGFLSPAQRARLLVMRERLLQRVHEMQEDRRGFRHRGDGH
ncbi:MAG TPA: Spy/CpxP family protein refolding chaperone [Gemmatimonadales bacterium]|nr:Spy/CpxP family protein refolding chaperone [Gemmatimonadales bacterium]